MNTVPETVHGGLDFAELRSLDLDASSVLDFSASINPLGAPPGVWDSMRAVSLAAYPDRDCYALRERLADTLQVSSTSILIGNGSTELIHLLARAYLQPQDCAVIFAPTFGEYETGCRIAGARTVHIRSSESLGFQWDFEAALQTIRESKPGVTFLCNPNNPTGVYLDQDVVEQIAAEVAHHGVLVLDEAYVPFVREAWDSRTLLERPNVVILHSMTKDYALTALRVGYMLASPDVVARVRSLQVSWSVNTLAQAAAVDALAHPEHVESGRRIVERSKAYLVEELEKMGLAVSPGAANFMLVDVGDAARIRKNLLLRGICVRDCASFGLPKHIRIGMKKLDECERLVGSLRQALADD